MSAPAQPLLWGDVTASTPVSDIAGGAASPPPAFSSSSTSTSSTSSASSVNSLAVSLSEAKVTNPENEAKLAAAAEDELAEQPTGLHPNDNTAQVEILVSGQTGPSIYKAVQTFEQLGLSKELLSGVYDMKFTSPSKIQAQALPIILSSAHPNLIGQAHHGSGKTATFSLGVLSRVDPSKPYCQAVVCVPTRELALQVHSVLSTLAKYTQVKIMAAVPSHQGAEKEKGKITAQVVVGTPGTIMGKLTYRDIDTKNVVMLVADEADQMIAQDGLGDTTVRIKKKFNPKTTQILLFSATFDEQIRAFAKEVAPNAVEIVVKTEELSLDGIKQFYMDCSSEADKYTTLTTIFGLLEIGQSIIFVHTVATAKMLGNKMRADGYNVSLLHGKDMLPQERDRVMEDFRTGKTTVLITTNVLARGIDVLSVTLVINFDVPLNKYGKPDPETYIHRIGRSGRFGRKGVAINFVYNDKSRSDLQAIARHFDHNIVQLPSGAEHLETVTEIVQAALGAVAKK